MSNYIPGVCNIGEKEKDFRKKSGITGFVLTALYLIVIISLNLSLIFKFIIFFPIFITIVSYLQYRMHFCAEFGILGKYNFTDSLGKTLTVENKEYLRLDKIKAFKILFYSMVISIFLTIVIVVLL